VGRTACVAKGSDGGKCSFCGLLGVSGLRAPLAGSNGVVVESRVRDVRRRGYARRVLCAERASHPDGGDTVLPVWHGADCGAVSGGAGGSTALNYRTLT
jgi:hypothetical protein